MTVTPATTTRWAGVTGMHLHQVTRAGVLGLTGYRLCAASWIVIGSVAFIAAQVLPSIDGSSPGYVEDALAVLSGGRATGDIGLLGTVIPLEAVPYLTGGLLVLIALFRAAGYASWRIVGPQATEHTTQHDVGAEAVRLPPGVATPRVSPVGAE
jgi:hypothetical protein